MENEVTIKLKKIIREYLEDACWKVYEEFKLRTALSRIRFDIWATKNEQTIAVEIKSERKHWSKTGYEKGILYEAIGQSVWYSQFVDEVWVILPQRFFNLTEKMTVELPNVVFYPIEQWLQRVT